MRSLEKVIAELDSPSSYVEFKKLISQVNLENRASESLFKGKYQILLLENLLPWQKPIGQFFQTVLAICGVKHKKPSTAVDDSQYESSHLSDEDGDEDGCPLPVVFDPLLSSDACSSSVAVIKQLKEKFNLYPLSEVVGRKLLMLCNSIANEYKFPYPVIAMCHGRNPKSISILGNFKDGKLVQVVVNSHGSVSKHEQLPKLSSVKLSHIAGFVPNTIVEISGFAHYDVLLGEDNSGLQPCKNMNVVLECEWTNPEAILEPVSADCSCIAIIKAVAGDDESGASEMYTEIKLIKALRDSLDSGLIQWPNVNTHENLMERVEDFMKAEIAALLKKHITKPPPIAELNLSESIAIVVQGDNNNYDFTDKLWIVLKDCSSCEDLKDALTYVFQELSELMDPPFVHQKNVSTIALNIRNMREKAVSWPSLTSHLASQLLLEIGIEKLRKDYVILFAGLELAPYDSINYFLQPEIESYEAVTCLEKLHCVLELTIIGLTCLHLPKLRLSEFIRNVLKFYTTVPEIDLQHVFRFKIPASEARCVLDKMRPTIWEISLLSSDKDFKKQTILHYSTTPDISHIYAPKNYHPKLMLKDASYAFMTGILIEDGGFL